jgi:hypothetical protein
VSKLVEAPRTARARRQGRLRCPRAFVLGAIEESVCIELAAGRAADVERLHPDLTHLAFLQLFGEE